MNFNIHNTGGQVGVVVTVVGVCEAEGTAAAGAADSKLSEVRVG